MKLEKSQVSVRYFREGSVDEVASVQDAAHLAEAESHVRSLYPQATFVRCCEQEEDGGCVFVYPSPEDLALDEEDMRRHASEPPSDELPPNYGRWVGMIVAAENEDPKCTQPPRSAS